MNRVRIDFFYIANEGHKRLANKKAWSWMLREGKGEDGKTEKEKAIG